MKESKFLACFSKHGLIFIENPKDSNKNLLELVSLVELKDTKSDISLS